MSAVFATVLTVAHFGEAFVEAWRVEPGHPAPITLRLPRTRVRERDPDTQTLHYESMRAIVPQGQTVVDEPLATMVRIYERDRRPPRPSRLGAQWLIYFLTVLLAAAYMRRASSERAGLLRVQVSLLGLSLLVLVGTKIGLLFTTLPAFLAPVVLVPLWACMYVDRRTGLMLGLVIAACGSALVDYDPVITAVYITAAVAATIGYRYRKRNSAMVQSGLYAALTGAVVYVAATEIYEGFDLSAEIAQEVFSGPVSAAVGGLTSSLLALVLHLFVARLFGIVSRSELLNLSDLEQPLLQKMQNDAPGSWEHSRMMANLAEAAAASIQADALLTRVGAYYHDLGKSIQPQYFVENLQPGEKSPHEDLDPDVSADAIMAHVVEGVRILREGGIPEAVIEFAYTHHGTSVIEFFWHKCKKAGNPKALTIDAFRYPGMRPRTKETGILMLIDAIEAGARTVEPRTREKFEELVRRVIFSKLKQGQLDESGLDLAELRIVTARIVDSLCSAYHSRIRYPWQDKQDEAPREESAQVSETGQHAARTTGETTTTGKHKAMRATEPGEEAKRPRRETGERDGDGRGDATPRPLAKSGKTSTADASKGAATDPGHGERKRASTPPNPVRAPAQERTTHERVEASGDYRSTARKSAEEPRRTPAMGTVTTAPATSPAGRPRATASVAPAPRSETGERASSSQVLPRNTPSQPVAPPAESHKADAAGTSASQDRPTSATRSRDSDRPPAAQPDGDHLPRRASVSTRS